jgi:hypothetical protein
VQGSQNDKQENKTFYMERTMLRLSDDTGDKPTAKSQTTRGKGRTSLDDTADVRDILSGLVGKGASTLADETTRADYGRLQQLLGPQKAMKVLTQVFMHNGKNVNTPMEKRIQDFYDIGSNEPEVDAVLKNVKTAGYGVLPGFRDSSKYTNQMLTGKTTAPTTAAVDNSDLQNKVMLRLQK